MHMEDVEFGPRHATHERVPWPTYSSKGITLPNLFIEYLAHNEPLPPTEYNQVTQLRKTLSEEIQNQENEVFRLENKLQELRDSIDISQKKAAAYSVLLSPFRRLPNDVLHEIATHCRQDIDTHTYRTKSRLEKRAPCHTPSSLAGTCKHWRSTVHTVSALWQVVDVNCSDYTTRTHMPKALDKFKAKLETFTRLSKTLPFTIVLDETDVMHQEPKGIDASLRWIHDHWDKDSLSRLHELCIRPVNMDFARHLFQALAEDEIILPSIKTVVLGGIGRTDYSTVHTELDTTNIAGIANVFPNLCNFWLGRQATTLVLNGGVIPRVRSLLPSDTLFFNMTKLSLHPDLNHVDWVLVLKAFPQLRFGMFNLDCVTLHQQEIESSYTLVHDQLEELVVKLTARTTSQVLDSFKHVRFTHLVKFHLILDYNPSPTLPNLFNAYDHDDSAMEEEDLDPDLNEDNTKHILNVFGPSLSTFTLQPILNFDRDEKKFQRFYQLLYALPTIETLTVFFTRPASFYALLNFVRDSVSRSISSGSGAGGGGGTVMLPRLGELDLRLRIETVANASALDAFEEGIMRAMIGDSTAGIEGVQPDGGDNGVASTLNSIRTPPSASSSEIRNRFTDGDFKLSTRFKMVGQRFDKSRKMIADRMEVVERSLRDEYGMDVGIVVDEDESGWDVEWWYLTKF